MSEQQQGHKVKDSIWKDVIEKHISGMLRRAIPELYRDMDKSKEPVFIDKELRNWDQYVPGGAHEADFLVRIYLNDGSERWLLLHIEIQGDSGGYLPYRMYFYKTLILANHRTEPAALAIITESDHSKEPDCYISDIYGTRTEYRYNRLVIKDLDAEELYESDNPFDLALLAAYRAQETAEKGSRSELRRFDYLKELISLLASRGYDHDSKRIFLAFLETILNVQTPELCEEVEKYERKVFRGEESKVLLTMIEKKALAEGMEKGMEKGKAEGIAENKMYTALKMLADKMPPSMVSKYTDIPEDELANLAQMQ